MQTQIDIRSTLVGLSVGVAATFCLGATSLTPPQVGRYKMETMDNYAFVIDTATGKVWRGYYHAGTGGNTDSDFLKPKTE